MSSHTATLVRSILLQQLLQFYGVVQGGICAEGQSLTFTKVAGYSPRGAGSSPLLYAALHPGTAVSAECYNRCKSSTDCSGFVVDYRISSCYRIPPGINYTGPLDYTPNASYFLKVCLPVPSNCTDRAWSMDLSPGYELVGLQHTILQNVTDRWSCEVICLSSLSRPEPCLSANYHSASRTCTLSSENKWTSPDSFIPTAQYQSDYIENQCIANMDSPPCWHDPVYNFTSIRTDLQVFNLTQQQCEERCRDEMYFLCRGYSFVRNNSLGESECSLHTDPLLMIVGPTLQPQLLQSPDSLYVEMIPCIDMMVSCDEERLHIKLNSDKFSGRLFVQGHSDACAVQGRGQNSTLLQIPMPRLDGKDNPCGLTSALSIGQVNRTLVSTVVVVQYHQLIQTVNDRVIKVNCLLSVSSQPQPGQGTNMTLNASFNIQEPQVQSEITGIGGNVYYNGSVAKATMQVLDQRTGTIAKDVQLGDPLQLKITVDPPFNVSIVRAGHLIATSGSQQDSLLLLDWRGCPPDLTTFPALTAIDPHTLVADFKAFRFPSSPLLMLSIVLTICSQVCQPTDCSNGIISYGRRRRSIEIYREMPLQLALVVHDQNIVSNNLSQIQAASFGGTGNNAGNETVGGKGNLAEGEVCANFLTVALIVMFCFLIECIIISVFCCLLQRKKQRQADTISLRHDFQPPRHVTWADDNEIKDCSSQFMGKA